MSNSIADILGGKSKPNEPSEFGVIKRFMNERFHVVPRLSISNKNIVIAVPNSAIAGALRLSLHELQGLCQTDRRLIIRISQN